MAERAQVRNAADPTQVKRAARAEQRRLEQFTGALRTVLATPAGRHVLWDLIARAGVYRSVWDNSARIHYNAGRQDYGHELLATVIDADEEGYEQMEREARQRAKREHRETDAAHTPPANLEDMTT